MLNRVWPSKCSLSVQFQTVPCSSLKLSTATCHSISVGSRLLHHLAYARASSRLTLTTGLSTSESEGLPSTQCARNEAGCNGLYPLRSTNPRKSRLVTSERSIANVPQLEGISYSRTK